MDLISAQRDMMMAVFRQAGINRANYVMEVAAVARAAAAEGEYAPAMKGYELVGKALGALGNENHLHLHAGAGGLDVAALAQTTRMAQLTDAQLLDLAQMRDAREVEVVHEPVVAEPAAALAEVPDDPLFH
jgi:hypothetical protein